MANLFAPNGFVPRTVFAGSVTSFGYGTEAIAPGDPSVLFRGDVVARNPANGFITKATPGVTQIQGIFYGCQYTSVSQGRTVFLNFYNGNADVAPGAPVTAYVYIDPLTVFIVQSGNGGPVTQANVGQNINFQVGTGSPASQLSGAFADFATIGNSSTLPFVIRGLYTSAVGPSGLTSVPTDNGSDPTTPFNKILVGFNNQDFIVTTGI